MPATLVHEAVSVDFDGCIHEPANWQPTLGKLDTSIIDVLHAAGYAVAVSTCNDVRTVARALRLLGFRCWEDRAHRADIWSDSEIVLVTGRKVRAVAYLDDRAVTFCFGDDPEVALSAVEELAKLVTS